MKKYSALTLIVALAVGLSQIAQAQGGKEAKQAKGGSEANRLAREGAEALKSNDFDKSNEPRIYEERAYAEMKIYAYDKALADYAELIKLKPKEVRYYNFRAYIYEAKEDSQNSMAETEKALQIDPNNQEAKERKQRLERKEAEKMPTPPPSTPAPKKSPPAKKKP